MGRLWPGLLFGGVVAASVVAGVVYEDAARQRAEALARTEVRAIADAIRLRLEIRVNANMQIAEGLASYVAANPQLGAEDFSRLAESLLRHRSEVRNIALARDTKIIAVYPLRGNEAIVGVDYRNIADQWAGARLVRETGRPMVAGPVPLIQGGQAIIGRVPVFASGSWQDGGRDRFWGIVSVPIDMDTLFAHAGLTSSLPLDIALRGVDGRGADGAVFHGDKALFSTRRSERLTVKLPGGSWELAVAPADGWPTDRDGPGSAVAISLFGGIVLGGLAVLLAGGAGGLGRSSPAPGPAKAYPLRPRFEAALDGAIEQCRSGHRPPPVLLGVDLPPEMAGRIDPDACLEACSLALRQGDGCGRVAAGRYVLLLATDGERRIHPATGVLRRGLESLGVDTTDLRFATVTLSPEDADGEAVLARLDSLLAEFHPRSGGGAYFL